MSVKAWAHTHFPKLTKWRKDGIDPKIISVKVPGRRVVYVESIVITGAEFKVSQRGRDRTLETGQRNVHAWVVGQAEESGTVLVCLDRLRRAVYDPWKGPTFVDSETLKPVYQSPFVAIFGKDVYYEA